MEDNVHSVYWKVVVIKKNGNDGAVFPITAGECIFGRAQDADIRIQLPYISNHHCRIWADVKGNMHIENLSETNTTWKNGQMVNQPSLLNSGDKIQVAHRCFRLEKSRPLTPARNILSQPQSEGKTNLSSRIPLPVRGRAKSLISLGSKKKIPRNISLENEAIDRDLLDPIVTDIGSPKKRSLTPAKCKEISKLGRPEIGSNKKIPRNISLENEAFSPDLLDPIVTDIGSPKKRSLTPAKCKEISKLGRPEIGSKKKIPRNISLENEAISRDLLDQIMTDIGSPKKRSLSPAKCKEISRLGSPEIEEISGMPDVSSLSNVPSPTAGDESNVSDLFGTSVTPTTLLPRSSARKSGRKSELDTSSGTGIRKNTKSPRTSERQKEIEEPKTSRNEGFETPVENDNLGNLQNVKSGPKSALKKRRSSATGRSSSSAGKKRRAKSLVHVERMVSFSPAVLVTPIPRIGKISIRNSTPKPNSQLPGEIEFESEESEGSNFYDDDPPELSVYDFVDEEEQAERDGFTWSYLNKSTPKAGTSTMPSLDKERSSMGSKRETSLLTQKRLSDSGNGPVKKSGSPYPEYKRSIEKKNTSHVSGLKRLVKTPKEQKSITHSGVKRLVKTPKEDRRSSMKLSGVKRLVKTPKDDRKSIQLCGIKRLLRSNSKTPDLQLDGLRELVRTPKDTSAKLSGLKELVKTPKAPKETPLGGIKELLKSSADVKSPSLSGIRGLMKSPAPDFLETVSVENLVGVRELVKSPKVVKSPKLSGLKKLVKTPQSRRSASLGGIKELLDSPKEKAAKPRKTSKSPNLVGMKELVGSVLLVGVKELMASPTGQRRKSGKLPNLIGVRELLASPRNRRSVSLGGVKELLASPSQPEVQPNSRTAFKRKEIPEEEPAPEETTEEASRTSRRGLGARKVLEKQQQEESARSVEGSSSDLRKKEKSISQEKEEPVPKRRKTTARVAKMTENIKDREENRNRPGKGTTDENVVSPNEKEAIPKRRQTAARAAKEKQITKETEEKVAAQRKGKLKEKAVTVVVEDVLPKRRKKAAKEIENTEEVGEGKPDSRRKGRTLKTAAQRGTNECIEQELDGKRSGKTVTFAERVEGNKARIGMESKMRKQKGAIKDSVSETPSLVSKRKLEEGKRSEKEIKQKDAAVRKSTTRATSRGRAEQPEDLSKSRETKPQKEDSASTKRVLRSRTKKI